MNILTDVLSLIRRGIFAKIAGPEDYLVLGVNEEPDMTGVASPIPYRSIKLIKVRDFKVAANHCAHANSPLAPAVGTGQVYQKTVVDPTTLECTVYFRSLKSLSSNLTLAESADDDYVEITTTGEPNTAANVGSGAKVWKDKVGETLNFRTLVEGNGVTIAESTNEITISATGGGGGGEVNTASNVGPGTGFFKQKTGVDLEFKTLTSLGGTVTITQTATTIDLATASLMSFFVQGDTGSTQSVSDGEFLKINGGTGIDTVGSAGPTITVSLDNTAVTPGAYTNTTTTVDQQGRITNITEAYKTFTCLVTQTTTNDPVVTILNNDAGITLTPDRITAGNYKFIFGTAVDVTKTAIFMSPNFKFSEIIGVLKVNNLGTDFTIFVEGDNAGGTDDAISHMAIEIRIYP